MTERVEEVSDERLADLANGTFGPPFESVPGDIQRCLRELQEFRAQRRRQMQEG